MTAAVARVPIDDEAAPDSGVREAAPALPTSAAVLLTDLLLGACHADGRFCEAEADALRGLLRVALRADPLPAEVEERIAHFDPGSFDATAAARRLAGAGHADRRRLLELVCSVCEADTRVELEENEYMTALVCALSMAEEDYAGLVSKNALTGGWTAVKRAEDLVLGTIALAFLALPMLAIAAAVKATSPGPALFRQRRYGKGGREFRITKFRTMTVSEDGERVAQAQRGDARVTRLGAFLRRSSLDELPQIFDVLRGDMSLAGPRPHAVAHNEAYRKLIVRYMLRHQVKPGITGWAQVNGFRGETDTLEKMVKRVEHDLEYVERWSPWLDVKIMFLTVFGRKVRMNAY